MAGAADYVLTPEDIAAINAQMVRMNAHMQAKAAELGFAYFGLDQKKLAYAKPDALVMHPGPMNRGVEIAAEVADSVRSTIVEQVANGVAVRMAVLDTLSRTYRRND